MMVNVKLKSDSRRNIFTWCVFSCDYINQITMLFKYEIHSQSGYIYTFMTLKPIKPDFLLNFELFLKRHPSQIRSIFTHFVVNWTSGLWIALWKIYTWINFEKWHLTEGQLIRLILKKKQKRKNTNCTCH